MIARRVLIAPALLWPMAAWAQDAVPRDDIVVLGRSLPPPPGTAAYGSVVIDRDRLDSTASGRVEDALKDVAGLQQFRRSDSRSANPSAQGLTLRGIGGNAASRALVLVDGVPVTDPFFGNVPFSALSADRLSAVRVTRGGGSGPFGGGAVAGVVELLSADRADLPRVQASAFYGSDQAVSLSANISPDLGSGYASLSGAFDRGDGFYTTPMNQRVPATARAAYRSWSGDLRTVAAIDAQTQLQFHGTLFADDRTLRFRGADSHLEGQDASLRVIHRGDWQVEALGYLQARNFANRVISATTFRETLDQRNTPSTGAGGKIELRPPVVGGHHLRFGLDLRQASGTLYEDAYAATGLVSLRRTAGGREDDVGVFLEDDWTVGRLTLTGGTRLDRWTITDGFLRERSAAGSVVTDARYPDRHGTEATVRGGLLAKLGRGVSLRAAGYSGFRLPTLNELYRPFVVFPVTTLANPMLSPERSLGGEAGVDLQPVRGVMIGLTAFRERLRGAIANQAVTSVLRQRQNVQAIDVTGLEATIDAHRGRWALNASYAHDVARFATPGSAFDGLAPSQSPRDSLSATLSYATPAGPTLAATLRYSDRQFDDDLQADVLPPATTLDLVARARLAGKVSLVLRAENVFDAQIYTRNQAGSVDLGTPRRLWIGLRFAD